MSFRESDPLWDELVKASIGDLCKVSTSLKDGGMQIYLRELENCTAKGVGLACESFLKDPAWQGQVPKPGQLLARVPPEHRKSVSAGAIDMTRAFWWDIGGDFGGNVEAVAESERVQIAAYIGEFYNFKYDAKVARLLQALGHLPAAPQPKLSVEDAFA